MKPVTDDVVFSILEGLEQRERKKRAALEAAKIALPDKVLGSMGNRRGPRIRRRTSIRGLVSSRRIS